MLRLGPTVISLTMAEVIEFEERRKSAKWAEEENMITACESTVPKQARRRESSPKFRITSNGSIFNCSQATEASENVGLGTKTMSDFTDDESFADDDGSQDDEISEDEQSGMRPAPGQDGFQDAVGSVRHMDALDDDQLALACEPRMLSMTPRRFARMSRVAPPGSDVMSEAATELPRHDPGEGSSRAPATPTRQSSLHALTSVLPIRTARPETAGSAIRSASHASSASSVLTEPYLDPRALSPTPATPPNRAPVSIYNDALPPASQPQTPRNLAEARHQSRLEGSYTVPSRPAPRLAVQTPASTRRARWGGHGRREPSPPGIQSMTPGLRGLYGGRENLHDDQLYEEARRDLGVVPSRAERQASS